MANINLRLTTGVWLTPFVFASVLAACNAAQPTITVTASSHLPTHTALPSVTPTDKPTSTPRSTSTPFPTSTLVSPTATFIPTLPPAAPDSEPEGYLLKAWTEQDALSAISEGEGLNAPPALYESAYQIEHLQGYLITIEKEALLHLLDANSREEVHWKLAYNEATSFMEYPFDEHNVKDIIFLIEQALNSGHVRLGILEQFLASKGFTVAGSYEAKNLFGDGQPTIVLHIEAQQPGYLTKDVVLAISGSHPPEYRLTPLRDRWLVYNPTSSGGKEIVTVGDHNGNGQPEISSVIYAWGHAACFAAFTLYEWQGDYPDGRFVNITQAIPKAWGDYTHTDCDNVWGFSQSDLNGIQSVIETTHINVGAGSDCSKYVIKIRYDWTGRNYQRVDSGNEAFDIAQPTNCAVGWANIAGGLNEQAVSMMAGALKDWSPNLNALWGSASEDYFHFKLGTWYALQGQTDLARATLQATRDNPAVSRFNMASNLAQAYLARYENSEDTFAACAAVVELAKSELSQVPHDHQNFVPDVNDVQKSWGFIDPFWATWPDEKSICDMNDAFRRTVQTFQPESEFDLINLLRERHIPVWAVEQGDVNGDGIDDWIAVVNTDGYYDDWEFWALIRIDNKITAVEIPAYYASKSYYSALRHCRPVDGIYANIFSLGGQLYAFRIVKEKEDLRAEDLLAQYDLSNDEAPVIGGEANMIARECGLPDSYFWDAATRLFVKRQSRSLTLTQDLEWVEAILFATDHDTAELVKVTQVLQNLLQRKLVYSSESDTAVKLRFRYLLGLAYELSGDERNAVQTYWQLWSDAPDNPYALMARRKLEPIAP